MELDQEGALPLLLEQALDEKTSVIWAISRSLRGANYSAVLPAWLETLESRRRRAACRLAGRLCPDDWLVAMLRKRLEDVDNEVASAARVALELLATTIEADALVCALRGEEDRSHRWVLLEALLAIADPGDKHQPWPIWAQKVADLLPLSMQD